MVAAKNSGFCHHTNKNCEASEFVKGWRAVRLPFCEPFSGVPIYQFPNRYQQLKTRPAGAHIRDCFANTLPKVELGENHMDSGFWPKC